MAMPPRCHPQEEQDLPTGGFDHNQRCSSWLFQITFGMENDGLLDGSNEDCLYLNVYVPANRTRNELVPVAVWLHGGAFMFGSGSACWFGPQFWMIHNIVLVTLNYRLGPLGFLSLGTEEVPGNAGMLDQVAALQWVQENIHRFGGDPGKVTLMGQVEIVLLTLIKNPFTH